MCFSAVFTGLSDASLTTRTPGPSLHCTLCSLRSVTDCLPLLSTLCSMHGGFFPLSSVSLVPYWSLLLANPTKLSARRRIFSFLLFCSPCSRPKNGEKIDRVGFCPVHLLSQPRLPTLFLFKNKVSLVNPNHEESSNTNSYAQVLFRAVHSRIP